MRNQRSKYQLIATGLLAALLGGGLAAPAHADANVVPDLAFRQCLNGSAYLNQDPADSDITSAQLSGLTLSSGAVSCHGGGIASLQGVQYITNLTSLTVQGHQVTDLSPLAYRTGLTKLAITQGPLEDLTPLASLTNLQSLTLTDNNIASIAPLSGLTKLTGLSLGNTAWATDYGNHITDISPLAGLTSLGSLGWSNAIPYTEETAGKTNHVTDFSTLAHLTALWTLNVSGTGVSSLAALPTLPALVDLYANNNQITDLTPVAASPVLAYISVTGNQITDLSPLSGLTKLGCIYADNNQITDLAPLAGLSKLDFLSVMNNQITSLEALASMPQMENLYVSDNPITDLSPLAGLQKLTWLKVSGLQVSDISPLATIYLSLGPMEADRNQIVDASALTAAVYYVKNGSLREQTLTLGVTAEAGDTLDTYTVDSLGLKSANGSAVTLSTDELCSENPVEEVTPANTAGPFEFYWCSADQRFSGTVTLNVSRPSVHADIPTIEGVAEVGKTLTVDPGDWEPAPVDFTYQWLRDGEPIEGATGSTYQITQADLGVALSVEVTGSKTDYEPVTEVSDPTEIVTQSRDVDPWSLRYESFTLTPDLTGDGKGEALAIQASDGALHLYAAKGDGTFQGVKVLIKSGLNGSRAFGPGDWTGDGKADVITVDKAGVMWLHKGNGKGGLAAKVQNGRGWAAYRIAPAEDLNRDGANDLLAIDQAGKLWLYAGDGKGGFVKGRVQVGHGWNGFDLYGAADLNKDGKMDILSISSTGLLYAYFGRGDGHFDMPVLVGHGWGSFTLAAGGDLNGDHLADIIGRNDTNGTVYYYQSKGGGQFAHSKVAAKDW
ncbi:MAG: leucine-rich repeat domain-containing protein [Bifidobacteriaceae bacterium]|jgi:Leucine-rich repeat (LRR) protein|nr:leucine-rich repeat domain-containing protein [Bifidobacteriaceae bacterium]